jgi:sialic acid synthase SpsE
VILSSGMSDFSEIKKVIDLYISKRHKMITLLHCVSVYPAEIKKLNLNFISTLKKLYPDLIIGFSDHTNEILTGALSCSAGAKVIEKHITFSNNFPGPDHKASLTISNFKKYTKMIRLAQISLGKEIKSIYNDELEIKKIARKSLAYSKDLKKGNRISKDSMHALRPGNGISTFEYKNLIGKILKKDVKKNTLLRGSDFLNG